MAENRIIVIFYLGLLILKNKGIGKLAILYGEDFRLVADAPFDDLVKINPSERAKKSKGFRTLEEQSLELFKQDIHLLKERREFETTEGYAKPANYFQIPGRVLHLDGDPLYLKKCLTLYEKIGIPVTGIHCHEKEMPQRIGGLIDYYRPDILVITGHDAYSKSKGEKTDINAYRHSKDFVQTVKEARKEFQISINLLFLQVHVNRILNPLLGAGANFASSPVSSQYTCTRPCLYCCKN